MKVSSLLATLVVVGYLAFEVSMLYRQGYRMEPLFVYEEFVTADHAAMLCGNPDSAERDDFLANFRVVERNALADLTERHPELLESERTQHLADLQQGRLEEMDEFIRANGCGHKEVWRWVKLHEVRARLNLR